MGRDHDVKTEPNTLISVVVPAYNEEAVIEEFHRRLIAVADAQGLPVEIVYVDDGSTDRTCALMAAIASADSRVSVVELSRNFGKEIALTAGLDHAAGDAVIVIDADLQDPPELIPELVAKWREGFEVVYAQRVRRDGETWLKRWTASRFYQLIQHTGRVRIPKDTGDFRLMSRRALDALLQLREHHRFMKGLFAWIGFPQTAVPYVRDPRFAGETKWNYWKLWNFALEGITSFTVAPLKIATYVGLITAIGAFSYGLVIIVKTLALGVDTPGYASLMVVVLFLGGVQLMALGVIGEYLGRTFNEVKNRPLYVVGAYRPAAAAVSRRRLTEGQPETTSTGAPTVVSFGDPGRRAQGEQPSR
jgi:glycosyltransferase involved in cell wall biosynthesis